MKLGIIHFAFIWFETKHWTPLLEHPNGIYNIRLVQHYYDILGILQPLIGANWFSMLPASNGLIVSYID